MTQDGVPQRAYGSYPQQVIVTQWIIMCIDINYKLIYKTGLLPNC